MNERELVQHVLTHLPRPAPPPRLRQRVLTQVRQEAAEEHRQTWSRIVVNGGTVERRTGAVPPSPSLPPSPPPTFATAVQWREEILGSTVHRRVECR